jgi:hypothetical protein
MAAPHFETPVTESVLGFTVSRRWGSILPGRSIVDRSLLTQRIVGDCLVACRYTRTILVHTYSGTGKCYASAFIMTTQQGASAAQRSASLPEIVHTH